MLTVIGITVLNSIFKDSDHAVQVLWTSFPMDTDYIALPAVTASIVTLVFVSLMTPKPDDSEWQPFMGEVVD